MANTGFIPGDGMLTEFSEDKIRIFVGRMGGTVNNNKLGTGVDEFRASLCLFLTNH